MSASDASVSGRRLWWLVGLVVAATLFAGWRFVGFVAASGDRLERERILALARTAAATLESARIAGLSGTSTDIGNPALDAVRAELRRVRDANPDFRFVYLMRPLATGSEDLVFLADAEAPDSPDYSAPGDVYDGPSNAIRAVWREGVPEVEPPSRDRWGHWVTGLAPVRDDEGRVLAVLGMDMRADDWIATQARYRSFALTICALVLLLELLFACGLEVQRRMAMRLAALNRQLAQQMAELERSRALAGWQDAPPADPQAGSR